MLPSTMPLTVSTEAFPRSGEGIDKTASNSIQGRRAKAATQTLSVSHPLDSSPEGEGFFAVRRIAPSPSQSPAVTALPKGEPLA